MDTMEQGTGPVIQDQQTTVEVLPPDAPPAPPKRKGNPFQPGHPRYGGRRKGVQNKRTRRAAEIAESMGVDPVEFMLELLRSDTVQVVLTNPGTGEAVLDEAGQPKRIWMPVSVEMKLDAAKAVAKYIHPGLMATQVTGKDEGPIAVAGLDLNKLLADPATVDAAQKLGLALAEHEAGKDPD